MNKVNWESLETVMDDGLIDTNILFYEHNGDFITELHILTRGKMKETLIKSFAEKYWKSVQKNKILLQ